MSLFQDESMRGMSGGAAAGAAFGPVGAAIGAIGGLFMGRKAKKQRRAAEAQALTDNTKTSYEISEMSAGGIRRERAEAAGAYQTDLATATARRAASGGSVTGGSWDAQVGQIAGKRDERLGQADIEREKYENSDAYRFVKEDYTRMARINKRDTSYSDETSYEQSIGGTGASGESFFNDEQRKMLKTLDGGNDYMNSKYEEYSQAVIPTLEEYETLKFGTDKERESMRSLMSGRIEEANKVYDEANAINDLNEEARRQREDY